MVTIYAKRRRKLMKLMQILAVAALLASSHLAYGQDETDVISANVPFAFTAAGVSMPAGHYVISRVQVGGQLWRLRTFGHAAFLTSRPRALHKAPAVSALLFDRDATGYTLSQFQQQAQTDAAEVANPGRAERRKSTTQQVASVTVPAR
jgi:hypothetical protein